MYNEPDYDLLEERREAKEQASIDRAEARRENPFLCHAAESALPKCVVQCDLCIKAQQKLEK